MDICVGNLNIKKCFELDYSNEISYYPFFFQDTFNIFIEEELKTTNRIKNSSITNHINQLLSFDFMKNQKSFSYLLKEDRYNSEKSGELVIKKYKYLQNLNHFQYDNYLYEFHNKNKCIRNNLDFYMKLNYFRNKLSNHNIYFFQYKKNNIYWVNNNIYLKNLYFSFSKETDIYQIIPEFLNKCKEYSTLPFEIHMLFYIYKNNIDNLDDEILEIIIENYIGNFILKNIVADSIEKYIKDKLNKYCRPLIQLSKKDRIDYLLLTIDTWGLFNMYACYFDIATPVLYHKEIKSDILEKIKKLCIKILITSPKDRHNYLSKDVLIDNILMFS